jgi:hypothetical protein
VKRRRRGWRVVAALLAFLLTAYDGDSYGQGVDEDSVATCQYAVGGGDGGHGGAGFRSVDSWPRDAGDLRCGY